VTAATIQQQALAVVAGAHPGAFPALLADPIVDLRIGDYRAMGAAMRILDLAGISAGDGRTAAEDALADRIRDAYDPATLPPGPTPGLDMAVLAAATSAGVRACVGQSAGAPRDAAAPGLAAYAAAWQGGAR
jgi:hypothetical protein